jgi:uncharacterized protein YdhG (YjbR/CyaY superfamily)
MAPPAAKKPTTRTAIPKSVAEYLAGASPEQRAALTRLRKTIRAAAPRAVESIGYGIAAFKLSGKPLAYFGYWKDHCSLYGFGKAVMEANAAELAPYKLSRGTIQFLPSKPLPDRLVRALVKGRMAEIKREVRS